MVIGTMITGVLPDILNGITGAAGGLVLTSSLFRKKPAFSLITAFLYGIIRTLLFSVFSAFPAFPARFCADIISFILLCITFIFLFHMSAFFTVFGAMLSSLITGVLSLFTILLEGLSAFLAPAAVCALLCACLYFHIRVLPDEEGSVKTTFVFCCKSYVLP